MKYEVKVHHDTGPVFISAGCESYELETEGAHTTLTLFDADAKETVILMSRDMYATITQL